MKKFEIVKNSEFSSIIDSYKSDSFDPRVDFYSKDKKKIKEYLSKAFTTSKPFESFTFPESTHFKTHILKVDLHDANILDQNLVGTVQNILFSYRDWAILFELNTNGNIIKFLCHSSKVYLSKEFGYKYLKEKLKL